MQKITQDLKKFGTTLSLAAAGTLLAGPIGLVVGGVAGGAIDVWRARRAKKGYVATPAAVATQAAIARQMTAAGQNPPLALTPMMAGSRAAARQAAATVAGESPTSIKG